mgnify:CR=1 FL=1
MSMLPVNGAYKINFKRHGDSRGYFNELFNEQKYDECVKNKSWKQVSFSSSSKNVLRGLHCSPYGKFITCTRGSFYDVIADFRPDSPTFGRWCKILLTSTNCTQVYVPAHCGHGFYTLEDDTNALYLQEGCFDSSKENDTHPYDPFINVQWPTENLNFPILSEKDSSARHLSSRMEVPLQPRQRILVIGGSGQIGSSLIESFEKVNCIGTYCHSTPTPGMIHFDMEKADVPGYTEEVFEMVLPTHVFICTGFTWVDGCENDTEKCDRLNNTMPAHVCKVAKKYACKTIWFSTDYVFDGSCGPYTEDSVPNPVNEYGRAKLRGEKALRHIDEECLIIRTNVVYGPDPNRKNFGYQLLDEKIDKVPSDQFGTPTYNKDIAQACKILTSSNALGIYHITGSEFLSREELTEKVCNCFGMKNNYTFVKTYDLKQSAIRPLKAGLVNTKLKTFKPLKIEQALEDWKTSNV